MCKNKKNRGFTPVKYKRSLSSSEAGNFTGFTLIELMIVIAVVAVLATFILVALSGAREAAEDSRRKGAVSQVRSYASVHYTVEGGYQGIKEAEGIKEIVRRYHEGEGEEEVLLILTDGSAKYCAEIMLTDERYLCTDGGYEIVEGHTDRHCTSESIDCGAPQS
jgi:prepilin-type N-terminal cleavage/methylation domain-containing protein